MGGGSSGAVNLAYDDMGGSKEGGWVGGVEDGQEMRGVGDDEGGQMEGAFPNMVAVKLEIRTSAQTFPSIVLGVKVWNLRGVTQDRSGGF